MGRIVAQLIGGKKMDRLQREMSAPMGNGRGERLLKEVIYPGVEQQFASESGFRRGQSVPWPKTQPFGRRPATSPTLDDTGRYKAAWTGGAGATSTISRDTVRFGVDQSLFPQVRVFQKHRATLIRAKKSTIRTHRLAMQMYLGMEYGAWISEKKLLKGLRVVPRPVGVSPEMDDRGRALLVKLMIEAAR